MIVLKCRSGKVERKKDGRIGGKILNEKIMSFVPQKKGMKGGKK